MNLFHWRQSGQPRSAAAGSNWDWTLAFDGTKTPVKTSLFVLLCMVWILPGLVGHEPWKGDEAATFGVIYNIVKTGNWLIPALAGEPFLERPPLYHVVAALFAKIFSPLMPVHDAARLASGFFNALTLFFTAMIGHALFGERVGRITVIVLLGTLGLLLRLHEMVSDTALLAGFTIGFYGYAIAEQKPRLGAVWLGVGIAAGFLARGFIAISLLGTIGLTLPIFFRHWRTRTYLQFAIIATPIALIPIIAWMVAFHYYSPVLFNQWLYTGNFQAFWLNLKNDFPFYAPLYYLRLLPWYTWPALPMALWTLWRVGKARLGEPRIHLPMVSVIVVYLVLSLAPDAREVRALPMLIPLALLAAAGVDTIRRGAASALDWFGMMTFGLFSVLLWLGWIGLRMGAPAPFVAWVKDYQPGFEMPFRPFAFSVALLLSVVYFITVARTRRSNRRAIVNWTNGITVFWMLAMTLWLPLIDEGRSYRSTMTELRKALPVKYNCVASNNLGEAQRALLDYYANVITKRAENGEGTKCHVLLVQGIADKEPALPEKWVKIWEGNRPGDKIERLRLYRRDTSRPYAQFH